MIERHRRRLQQLRERVLMAQLGGAAGTLASLGDAGLAVRKEYAAALDLAEPDITWHVARDGLVETVQLLGLVTGSLGKVGLDVMLMMATELGEAFEPFAEHRGASSTMPQKAEPDLIGSAGRQRQGRSAARGPHAGRDVAGFRACHRTLACRMDCSA